MSATPRRRCPVCYRRIKPTLRGLIYGHWDSAGHDRCPGSWEPYDITISGERRPSTNTPPLEIPA